MVTARDADRLREIRKRSKLLVALGSCAVWGGVAAMDRSVDRPQLLEEVYGQLGSEYDACPTQALREVVKVDLNITGCPIEKEEFISGIAALLNGDAPVQAQYPVCTECRMRENNCLLIERGLPCCGPVTAGGCDARCPQLRVPCIGCRGPMNDANPLSLLSAIEQKGFDRRQVVNRLRTFAPEGVA